MASMAPEHDTHPLVVVSGELAISILAADRVDVGQHFSYPGRRFHHVADEWVEMVDGRWLIVPDSIAWLGCEV